MEFTEPIYAFSLVEFIFQVINIIALCGIGYFLIKILMKSKD